jgi:GTPase Era involved in 16S rRNA processing
MVGTKADKLSGNALRKSMDAFTRSLPGLRVVPYSARTGNGRDQLWQEIRIAIQNFSPASRELSSDPGIFGTS